METTALSLTGVQAATVTLLPGAENAKAAALQSAAAITEITTADDVQSVSVVLSEIKGLKKTMVDSHAAIKAPVLAISREIDGIKKEYLDGLEREEKRLSLLLGAHQENERRKAEAARKAAEAEERRIAQEAEERERQRIALETQGRTGTLLNDLDEIREDTANKVVAVRQQAVASADLAPAGTAVRKNWKFEVEDIHALYAANPELVNLTANKAAINAIIKTGRKLPGLRIWSESIASVKAATVNPAQIAEQYDY